MELKHTFIGTCVVISPPPGHLDAGNANDFKNSLLLLLTTLHAQQVVLDISTLEFIDSSGLGSLLASMKWLKQRGGDIKLAAMTKRVRTIFEIVRLHKIFEIYPTVDDAVRAFQIHETTPKT